MVGIAATTAAAGRNDRRDERPLPNDACPETRRLEREFFEGVDVHSNAPGRSHRKLVLYSRSLKTHYDWPFDRPLDLRRFSATGHTIGIDGDLTWVRNFFLDMDCSCRARSAVATTEHLDENAALRVKNDVIMMLTDMLQLKGSPPAWELWRRDCGYHLYVNVPVTMLTHLTIGRMILARHQNVPFALEVPSVIPLPHSAKSSGDPYTLFRRGGGDDDRGGVNVSLPSDPDDSCYDMFEYTGDREGRTVVAQVQALSSLLPGRFRVAGAVPEEISLVYLVSGTSIARVPCERLEIPGVVGVTVHPEYSYLRDFASYLLHVSAGFEQIAAEQEIDAMIAINRGLGRRAKEVLDRFMRQFNRRRFNLDDTRAKPFVDDSYGPANNMDLQHYVVALHKFMREAYDLDRVAGFDDALFRDVLRAVYRDDASDDPVLRRFVEHYDSRTRDAYPCGWSEMLDHLVWRRVNTVDPHQTYAEQLYHLLALRSGFDTPALYHEYARTVPKKERKELADALLLAHVRDLREMHCALYNSGSRIYYVNATGSHHEINPELKNKVLPQCVHQWITNRHSDQLYSQEIQTNVIHITTEQIVNSPFLLSTDCGVFNAITGLYSSSTRFLKFTRSRTVAVWPFDRVDVRPYDALNADLLDAYEQAGEVLRRCESGDAITRLFVHAILAPACMELQYRHSFAENDVPRFLKTLAYHHSVDSADFLVDHFPFPIPYVYTIMRIVVEHNMSVFYSYDTLSLRVLRRLHTEPDDWRRYASERTFEYRSTDECATYLEQLRSIRDDRDFDENEPTVAVCVYAVLLGLILSKTETFRPFCDAFGCDRDYAFRMTPRTRHPMYPATMSHETSVANQIESLRRAVEIVFGDLPVCAGTTYMIESVKCLAASVYFDPRRFVELLDSMATLHLAANLNKRAIIYYGRQNTGKSLQCNLVQSMCSPMIGRFTDFTDAVKRANVNNKVNAIILNEAKTLNEAQLKSMTGSDGESTSIFFVQNYEVINQQALLFGATNTPIRFTDDKMDMTAVNRIYGIEISGEQVSMDSNPGCWTNLMCRQRLLLGSLDSTLSRLVPGLRALTYVCYAKNRDAAGVPRLNDTSETVAVYRHNICMVSYTVYRFLNDIDVAIEPEFSISARSFKNIVTEHIERSNQMYATWGEFLKDFEKHYQKFDHGGVVEGFQTRAFVDHVKTHMAAHEVPEEEEATITNEQLRERLGAYGSRGDRENARSYFERTYQRFYDYRTQRYRNIEFSLRPVQFSSPTRDGDQYAANAVFLNDNSYGSSSNGGGGGSGAHVFGGGSGANLLNGGNSNGYKGRKRKTIGGVERDDVSEEEKKRSRDSRPLNADDPAYVPNHSFL